MISAKFIVLIVLMNAIVATAQVYKWVDKDGRIHFGDNPPEDANVILLEMPAAPSDEKISRANKDLQEMLENRQKLDDVANSQIKEELVLDESEGRNTSAVPTCATPFFGGQAKSSEEILARRAWVDGPRRKEFSNDQVRVAERVLSKIGGDWHGTLTELTCTGPRLEERQGSLIYKAEVKADWESGTKQLSIESKIIEKRGSDEKTIMQYFDVDTALYYRDKEGDPMNDERPNVTSDGNKVDVIRLRNHEFTFQLHRTHTKSWGPGYGRALVKPIGTTYENHQFQVSSKKLSMVVAYGDGRTTQQLRIWNLKK